MDHSRLIAQLACHRTIFLPLLTGLTAEEVRWKPAPEKWCLLEVVCHLHDEEREDFRARLKHVLETPEAPLPPIDPTGWVAARKYMEQDFGAMRDKFLAERDRSVAWLQGLKNPAWTNAWQHPEYGPMSASLFLVNWVAHDLHHFRQINVLRYGYLASISSETLKYAGNW